MLLSAARMALYSLRESFLGMLSKLGGVGRLFFDSDGRIPSEESESLLLVGRGSLILLSSFVSISLSFLFIAMSLGGGNRGGSEPKDAVTVGGFGRGSLCF